MVRLTKLKEGSAKEEDIVASMKDETDKTIKSLQYVLFLFN